MVILYLNGGETMYEDYIIYRCEKCGFEFIIPIDGLRKAEVLGRIMTCPLGHRPIWEMGRYDNLRECMESANTYERRSGSMRQTRYNK